jgi:hypothetical protein
MVEEGEGREDGEICSHNAQISVKVTDRVKEGTYSTLHVRLRHPLLPLPLPLMRTVKGRS